MATHRTEALDPRLRRIVASLDDPSRLRRDLEQSILETSESFEAGEPVKPEVVTTRALVKTTSEPPTTALPETTWIHVVDTIYSVTLPVSLLEELGSLPGVEFVEAPRLLYPMLSTSLAETRADQLHQPPFGLTGDGVVVGIIDFGLDYTLDDFIAPNGATRVAFLWDQSLVAVDGEHAPAGFGYGVEYTADDINAALAAPEPFAVVRHEPDPGSHGTHVAGIAAGNGRTGDGQFPVGRFVGAAPGATIIFVQPHTTDAQTTFTDSTRVAEAMSYIFAKATELGMPCVVNMSLGQNGGSHDGESIVERAIDRLLEEPGHAFVLAAGNEHTWRGHASGHIAHADVTTLQWRAGGQLPRPDGSLLPPGGGDRTPNEMEIWYAPRDQFRARVISPDGASTAAVTPGQTVVDDLPNGNQVFIDSERLSRLNGDARIYVEVAPGTKSRVAPGVWQVELTAVESRDGRFDAWIERDARDANNAFSDQSFFVGADFDEQMTLGTPATTRRGIAVANYNHVLIAPNDSSSRGRTRDGRTKPEVAAPGTNIVASGALGGRKGPNGQLLPLRVRKTGTSMSAPHVAGIVALLLQRRPDLSASQIRGALIAAASAPANVQPFDKAWGYGRIDAQRVLAVFDQVP